VQKQINSGEAKQMDRTLANTRHGGSLRYSDSFLRSTASRIRMGCSLRFRGLPRSPTSLDASAIRLRPSVEGVLFFFAVGEELSLRNARAFLPSKPCDRCVDDSTLPACTINIGPL
jgi:hypothetical protein